MNVKHFFFGLCLAFTAHAQIVVFQSPARQTSLLELYTSEACSSCPPAESWLSGLKSSPGLWADFVPVAFHVNYWNHLGWRDKWSSQQYTDRQQSYATAWGSETIYTPEFVLNGKEWHNWMGLRGAPGPTAIQAGILTVSSESTNRWRVIFTPATSGRAAYEVSAALLDSDVSSDVKAGENQGRHLNHDFAALTLVNQPLAAKADGYSAEFTLDPGPMAANGRLALAVWVSRAGELEPLQAVGGWLPKPAGN